MYESPVELFDVASYTKKANEEIDNYVYEYIVKLGINVNKEELIKALQYDRDQYEKGYKDGRRAVINDIIKQLVQERDSYNDDDDMYQFGNYCAYSNTIKMLKKMVCGNDGEQCELPTCPYEEGSEQNA